MSTGQLQLQSGTWTDTFPENQVTQQQSTVFVKKLLAIAISNIAYLRVVFPEKAFSDRRLEDLNLKILKNDKSCPFAVQLIDWLKGVFDAVEKKYLRMLILGLYRRSSDPNTLLEMYSFRFSYTDTTEMEIYSDDRKISSASTASQTRKATISLLRNLVLRIRMLSPLPDDVSVMMKLFYYDEVTPEDYEPPGFTAAETDFIRLEGNPQKFRFHTVSTAFHSLQLRVIADTAVAGEDEEAESVQNDQLMTQDDMGGMDVEIDDAQSREEYQVNSGPTTPETDAEAEQPAAANGADVQAADVQAEESYSDVEPLGVRCPCLVNEDDGIMVLCSVCHYWQHAICFKIRDQNAAPTQHVCNLCCSNSSAEPTDPELAQVNESEAQAICLWRRSLAACLEVSYISSAQLASRLGVDDSVAAGLVDRLVSEGYATPKGRLGNAKKYVQKRKIKHEALVKYFSGSSETAMEVEP